MSLAAIVLSVLAVVAVGAAGGGLLAEVAALSVAWGVTTALRFGMLGSWAARGRPVAAPPAAR